MQESSAWRELGDRFNELARDIHSDFDGDWTPTGGWLLIGVTNQSTVKSFIAAAERGAALLGCAPEKLSYSFWLDELKQYGQHYETAYLIGPGQDDQPGDYEEHGRIRRVRAASAEYCQFMETRAIAVERQVPTRSGEREPQVTDPEQPSDTLENQSPSPVSQPSEKRNRRGQVDNFLAECDAISGCRIFRRHIWLLAGHSKGRQFEYWQRDDPKATRADDRNFTRVLQMSPSGFIATLKRKELL